MTASIAGRNRKVLVVDDESSIRELLALVLQDAGYEVNSAGDGREAIVLALRDTPDVIVLDILMPGFDGWQTCEHLLSHDQTASVPIIFLTARAGSDDQLHGWNSGCFDYITKPFEVELLLERVALATAASPAEIDRAREALRQVRLARLETDGAGTDSVDPQRLGRPAAG